MRRWAKPVIPISVENDVSRVEYVHGSGLVEPRLMHRALMVLKDEDVSRIRSGYVCIHCQEPFERPYPPRCGVCGFEVGKYQRQAFTQMYEGVETPVTSLEDKLAALDEQEERERLDAA